MLRFSDEELHEVYAQLKRWRDGLGEGRQRVGFSLLDPDLFAGHYNGEVVTVAGQPYRYRSYRSLVDLAERLECRLLTPERLNEHEILVTLETLAPDSPHDEVRGSEKYGSDSLFSRIQKLEEPDFLFDYTAALERVPLEAEAHILDLGINTGDEFSPFARLYPEICDSLRFTGVDHAATAIAEARVRFPTPNYRFLEADINGLESLGLEPADLVISIGTLQSPGIDAHAVLRTLVQRFLKPRAGIILGFPNGRYRDGALRYGAKTKNYREPELSLLVQDVAFYKRYLQQHRFRVTVQGKYYLFLTAVRQG